MTNNAFNYLIQQAKTLPFDVRKKGIASLKEVEMHSNLKTLFQNMEPSYQVEITHQAGELGKDLVIVKKDKLTSDAIAVIVKCGDIRGKTAGDVDDVTRSIENILGSKEKKVLSEIESQIRQAVSHPAEIKTDYSTLFISKIIIVIVGEIGSHVRKRLNAEVDKTRATCEIFDLHWLIDKFTEHYPQFFFSGNVIDFFQRKIQELEVKYCITKCGKNLSEYFVDPRVAEADSPIRFDEESLPLIFNRKKLPFSDLASLLSTHKRLILLGDPGVGKSGTLAKLAIDIFQKAYANAVKGKENISIEIPILISARELSSLDTVDALLQYYVSDRAIQDTCKIQVLMIDALDEISSKERSAIIQKAQLLANELSSALIITSRKIDVVNIPQTGFEKYELLPFQFKQATRLFEKLIIDKKHLDKLKQGLEKIKYQIPMIPLSLILLIDLVEERREIPASVTELYDRFLDAVLGRWDKDKGIEVLFEYLVKKKFLAALAYDEFLKKNRLEIPVKEFESYLEEYTTRYGCDISYFVKEIERSGVIHIGAEVMYSHRSFLDYFAAFYIFEKRADFSDLNDYIVDLYFSDLFSDGAFYYIGLMREINDVLLNKIFDYDKDGIIADMEKFLCGRLLQAGWHTETKIKSDAIEKAVFYAPKIYLKYLEIKDKKGNKMPRIFGDFLLAGLADYSFGSSFLFDEVKNIFDKLSADSSRENLYVMLILFWAMHRRLEASEIAVVINVLLDGMAKADLLLNAEDKARFFLLLSIIDDKDNNKEIKKVIDRKLNKLKKRFPDIFRGLLPSKPKIH
jgi:hypothetical protein